MCQVTDELLEKTIGEMSGIEFIQLIKAANEDIIDDKPEDEEDKYVYGIAGIAELFHCSLPQPTESRKAAESRRPSHKLAERLSLTRKWLWNWQNSPFIIEEGRNSV